eukprot:gb/GECH01000864.1/.p1 GENE.gb/GECH01000864.1/~~gb/GECH01000864.1/.p1  ORF type:complete len:251 (+),score=60.00 gb/GECH01000864.1/:1-753(+)
MENKPKLVSNLLSPEEKQILNEYYEKIKQSQKEKQQNYDTTGEQSKISKHENSDSYYDSDKARIKTTSDINQFSENSSKSIENLKRLGCGDEHHDVEQDAFVDDSLDMYPAPDPLTFPVDPENMDYPVDDKILERLFSKVRERRNRSKDRSNVESHNVSRRPLGKKPTHKSNFKKKSLNTKFYQHDHSLGTRLRNFAKIKENESEMCHVKILGENYKDDQYNYDKLRQLQSSLRDKIPKSSFSKTKKTNA